MFGYANKTWLAYQMMFKLFMAFCFFIGKNFCDSEYKTVLLYIEFLVYNGLKHASIVNHISAVRSYGKWLDLDMSHLNHFKVTLMLKAVANSVKHPPKFKGIFDVNMLERIILTCNVFPHAKVYKSIYLLAFFGFLRISNLVPSSVKKFDWTKQLCREDVLLQSHQAVVILKWSKTMQATNQGSFIIIPRLDNVLCPMLALKQMYVAYKSWSNGPLFVIDSLPVTDYQVRAHLAKVFDFLHIDKKFHSFHTFRRSGATLAYNLNVDIQKIQRHGTWSSDTVNTYIVNDPQIASGVAACFKKFITQ